MPARRRKSKKPYAANSSSRPPKQLIFFLDRSLGKREIAAALRQAGVRVEIHDDHFQPDAPDEYWLDQVGAQGWIVLTKDDKIRYRAIELAALRKGGVRAFVLTGGNLQGREMGQIFVKALPRMTRLAIKHRPAFIGKVTRAGKVSILLKEK